MYNSICSRRCDGIGRRARLKILCPQGRAGSTPATGTIEMQEQRQGCCSCFLYFVAVAGVEGDRARLWRVKTVRWTVFRESADWASQQADAIKRYPSALSIKHTPPAP